MSASFCDYYFHYAATFVIHPCALCAETNAPPDADHSVVVAFVLLAWKIKHTARYAAALFSLTFLGDCWSHLILQHPLARFASCGAIDMYCRWQRRRKECCSNISRFSLVAHRLKHTRGQCLDPRSTSSPNMCFLYRQSNGCNQSFHRPDRDCFQALL